MIHNTELVADHNGGGEVSGMGALNLEGFLAWQEAMLDPQRVDGLVSVTLREVQRAWENALHDVLIYRSANVVKSAADNPLVSPFTICGIVRAVVLDFCFRDRAEPVIVGITPPRGLRVEPAVYLPRVETWLGRSGIRVCQKLAVTGMALLLAWAGVAAPIPDGGEEDDTEEEESCAQSAGTPAASRKKAVSMCWSDGVMEWWSNGAMEQWSDGAMEQWSNGAMEQWNDRAVEFLRSNFQLSTFNFCSQLSTLNLQFS